MLGAGLDLSPAAVRAVRSAIAGGVPSLDLSFLYSILDPRVTFTRASAGTYTDSAGVLQTAATNAPRFDHDPVTGAAKGLLIEEARTNLLLRSAEVGNAAWTKVRATVASDAAVAPDGTLSADKLVEDATAANTHLTLQSVTGTSTVVHTFSFFAKSAERTRLQVQIDAGGASGGLAAVDLTTGIGSVTAGAGSPTLSVNAAGNGWWRIALTAIPAASGTTVRGVVYLADAAGATTYTGDAASGLLLWGMQIEPGAFATSYIPTTTVAATRAADAATIGTLTPWFNASSGTIFTDYSAIGVTAGSFPRIIEISNGTSNERFTINFQTSATNIIGDVQTGGVSQAFLGGTGAPTGKTVLAYALNDFAQCTNGGTVFTDTAGTLPTVSTMQIGNRPAGDRPFSGHMRRVRYFASRLPDATLQSITT